MDLNSTKGAAHMTRRLLFVLCLISLAAVAGLAQARRTVTNADLESYRQQRVAAEQQLRDEYARLGFPSPEELQRRNMESEQQLIELSARLKAERLERERMDLEREQMMLTLSSPAPDGYYDNGVGDSFYPAVLGSGFDRFRRGGRVRTQQGYFAGGQFWPQGPRTPLRPAIVQTRAVPHH
jgi:hypothetical protein